jgi:signal transduction histidine kinase
MRQLLALGRGQVLQPTQVDLNARIGQMAQLLAGTIGRIVKIELRLAPDLWPVFVDPDRLDHAILNLAINARDAMPRGGTLTIATANAVLPPEEKAANGSRECVLISLTDTGTGMTEEVLAQALDPFFTTKDSAKGSGLGLSQVYGFVRQSGGVTRITSELGHGTTVVLYLPRATQQ